MNNYTVVANGYILDCTITGDKCRKFGNEFPTRELAEEDRDESKINKYLRQMRYELSGDWVPDWTDDNNRKYCIIINHNAKKPIVFGWCGRNHIGSIPFKTREHAEQAAKWIYPYIAELYGWE